MAFVKRRLDKKIIENFGLSGGTYDVFSLGGESCLNELTENESIAVIIKNERDDKAKRAMIAWASALAARQQRQQPLYSRQDNDSDDDTPNQNPFLIDSTPIQNTAEELQKVARLMKKKSITLDKLKEFASSGQSIERAEAYSEVLKGYEKHGHKVPPEILQREDSAENDETLSVKLENLATVLNSLESRGLGQRAQMSGKRVKVLNANLDKLDEPGKGAALAKVIKLYSDNGLSLSDELPESTEQVNVSRLSDLMGKSTDELEAIHSVLKTLPSGSTNAVGSSLDRLIHNMDFKSMEKTIRDSAGTLAERVSQEGIRGYVDNPNFSAFDRYQPEGGERAEDNDAAASYSKGVLLAKTIDYLKTIPAGISNTTLTENNMRGLIKNPLGALVIVEQLHKYNKLNAKNANAFLELLSEEEPITPEHCKSLLDCMRAMANQDKAFYFTKHFERLAKLDAEQVKNASTLFEAAGSALDRTTTSALLDYIEQNKNVEESDVEASDVETLAAIIKKLVENDIPLHSLQGVKSSFKRQNFLEKLTGISSAENGASKLETVNQLLDAMKPGRISNHRVDMLLEAVSNSNITDPMEVAAIKAILEECESQKAPLTKHNLLKNLLGENREEVIALYLGEDWKNTLQQSQEPHDAARAILAGRLKDAASLEAIGELYDSVQKIEDEELRDAKMDVLKMAVNTANLADDPSILGRLKKTFSDLLARITPDFLGVEGPKVHIRDAVEAVKTVEDKEKVEDALRTPGAGSDIKLFRKSLQAGRQSAEPVTESGAKVNERASSSSLRAGGNSDSD
ncbi:hypothetical protein E3226_009810 [Legionella geestiana]|uniref:hypothetical protein n=1 Tax=Legionella geestiana TaxID=45065 RepID=UPI0010923B41|nr:hypothetical protein [Legionella geestiana]QDQ40667.1 hypothetical protein E3226_009810 [Legionella geestiana]